MAQQRGADGRFLAGPKSPAAPMLDVTIAGIDELNEAFRQMPENIVQKIVRRAVKETAPIFEWGVKRNARKHRDTGDMEKSITTVIKTYLSNNYVYAAIGPGGSDPHAHLVEHGHRIVRGGTAKRSSGHKTGMDRRGKRGMGATTGFVPPHPFVRPAEDAHKAVVERLLELKLLQGTQAELERILKAG